MLFCQGMADNPQESLSGRTPLEAAKTPFMDSLAKKGRIGSVNFIPHSLPAAPDIACMSILGYDPLECYTGAAPLVALARGISQSDGEVAFCYDFVTVSEDTFVEVTRRLSDTESELLVNELNAKLADPRVKFCAGTSLEEGILILSDSSLSEDLDDLECAAPQAAMGQKINKVLPQGKGAAFVKVIMDKAKNLLENHEINRVRIDLKENPANRIWLWGQGKKPKLPDFFQAHALSGTVVSEASFVRGLAVAAGLKLSGSLSEAIQGNDQFIFSYSPGVGKNDLKTKIRRIEEFDLEVVGPVCRAAEKNTESKILIGTDLMDPLGLSRGVAGDVPFLLWGAGVEAAPCDLFCEKSAQHKHFAFDQGHQLLSYFLDEKQGAAK